MVNIEWNMNETKEVKGGGQMLPMGAYVCKITSCEDVPEKQYLKVELDVAEGDFAGHFGKLFASAGFWGLVDYKSYKGENETGKGLFKHFIACLERSNNFTWNGDEKQLVGKQIGATICHELYNKQDGTDGRKTKIATYYDVEEIKKGEFTEPKEKKAKDYKPQENSNDPLPFSDIPAADPNDDLPF